MASQSEEPRVPDSSAQAASSSPSSPSSSSPASAVPPSAAGIDVQHSGLKREAESVIGASSSSSGEGPAEKKRRVAEPEKSEPSAAAIAAAAASASPEYPRWMIIAKELAKQNQNDPKALAQIMELGRAMGSEMSLIEEDRRKLAEEKKRAEDEREKAKEEKKAAEQKFKDSNLLAEQAMLDSMMDLIDRGSKGMSVPELKGMSELRNKLGGMSSGEKYDAIIPMYTSACSRIGARTQVLMVDQSNAGREKAPIPAMQNAPVHPTVGAAPGHLNQVLEELDSFAQIQRFPASNRGSLAQSQQRQSQPAQQQPKDNMFLKCMRDMSTTAIGRSDLLS
jgi:hypothetical protein